MTWQAEGHADRGAPVSVFAESPGALGVLGVAYDATVIAYDDRGGAFAGCLVCMIRFVHRQRRAADRVLRIGRDRLPQRTADGTLSDPTTIRPTAIRPTAIRPTTIRPA